MQELINSQIFLLTLTVGVYLGAIQLRRKINFALLHPVFVSILVLIVFIRLTGIEYEHYMQQTQIIDFMLGLSVVALGYILHDQIYNIRGNVISIVMAILVGSAVGIVSVALIARWMGAEPAVVASLEPKSVTTGHRPVGFGQFGRYSGIDLGRRNCRGRFRRYRRALGSEKNRC